MKNRFDLIIFDWDGTLINSIDWIAGCIQRAALRCDYAVPEYQAAKGVIGLSIERAMDALFPDIDESTQKQLVTSYAEEYFAKQIGRDDFFPGVYDMLVQLQQSGYQLAVATGKTRVGLAQALQATATGELFNVTRCADETQSKPHPKMLQEIIQVTGIAPERALMVGDSIHDLQMALNAQISSIAVTCGAHSEDLLQQYNPLLCLSQPAELLNII
jgi:phosphoglycolate phosphatase